MSGKVTSSDTVHTVAGTGNGTFGSRDGLLATMAALLHPVALALDSDARLLVAHH